MEEGKKKDESDIQSYWIESDYVPPAEQGDSIDRATRWARQQGRKTTAGLSSVGQLTQPPVVVNQVAGISPLAILGVAGSALLFLGVFMPIVSVPIVGGLNYFQNGKGDGTIILLLAVVSFALTLTRRYRSLWYTALGSIAVMLFTFVNFQIRMSQARSEMATELAGNPFKGLGELALQSVQLQWGWAVLVIGTVCLIAAAAMREQPNRGV